MRSEKGWYWLAAGVLALGLNGAYQDGQLGWVHCLANRATTVIERFSQRSLHTLAMAEWMLGRTPETVGRTEAAFQQMQSKMVAERVAQAQREIAMAQARQQIVQAQMQRKMDMVHMKMDKVRMIGIDRANRAHDCSGFSKVVVDLRDIPNVDIPNLPDIQIPDVSAIVRDSLSHSDGPI
jgi:hypothetical protein